MEIKVRNEFGRLVETSRIAMRFRAGLYDVRRLYGVDASAVLVSPECYRGMRLDASRDSFDGCSFQGLPMYVEFDLDKDMVLV